jgi:hypothetical protein
VLHQSADLIVTLLQRYADFLGCDAANSTLSHGDGWPPKVPISIFIHTHDKILYSYQYMIRIVYLLLSSQQKAAPSLHKSTKAHGTPGVGGNLMQHAGHAVAALVIMQSDVAGHLPSVPLYGMGTSSPRFLASSLVNSFTSTTNSWQVNSAAQ